MLRSSWKGVTSIETLSNIVDEDRVFYGIGFEFANGGWHLTAGKFTEYTLKTAFSFKLNPVRALTGPQSKYYLQLEGFGKGFHCVILATHWNSQWSINQLEDALAKASTSGPKQIFGWVLVTGSARQVNLRTTSIYQYRNDRVEPAKVYGSRTTCTLEVNKFKHMTTGLERTI